MSKEEQNNDYRATGRRAHTPACRHSKALRVYGSVSELADGKCMSGDNPS
jgi:hypothetical protein